MLKKGQEFILGELKNKVLREDQTEPFEISEKFDIVIDQAIGSCAFETKLILAEL